MSFIAKVATVRRAPAGALQSPHDPNRLISEATTPHLAAAVYRAFTGFKARVTPALVHQGMSNGDLMGALAPPLGTFRAALRGAGVFLATAHAQASTLAAQQFQLRKTSVAFDLDSLPPATQDALDDYTFGLVRDVSDDTLDTIAQVIGRGISSGFSPAQMARQLQGSIGLTATQDAAVDNYRSLLTNGSPEALNRALRDARSDGVVQDSIDGLRALSPTQVDSLVERYEDAYLRYRALTIARYESLHAANQGSSDAVQDAIDDGTVDPSWVTTFWRIHPDELTCPKCVSIVDIQPDGVPYGSDFTWATKKQSGMIDIAPLHPSCRCTNSFRVARPDDEETE